MVASNPGEDALLFRPFEENTSPLTEIVAASRPVPNRLIEDSQRFVDPVAGVRHPFDAHIVPGPKLDLEEVSGVRVDRIVGLFGGEVVVGGAFIDSLLHGQAIQASAALRFGVRAGFRWAMPLGASLAAAAQAERLKILRRSCCLCSCCTFGKRR
jgi:hypothetical protein